MQRLATAWSNCRFPWSSSPSSVCHGRFVPPTAAIGSVRWRSRRRMADRSASLLPQHGQRLMQIGVGLLLFILFEGFVIRHVAAPRVGLSVHTLGAMEGTLLLLLGMVWSRLDIDTTLSRLGFALLIYSNLSILSAYSLAAVWAAGKETMPIATRAAGPGRTARETTINNRTSPTAPPATGCVVM